MGRYSTPNRRRRFEQLYRIIHNNYPFPLTSYALAQRTGFSQITVQNMLKTLHRQGRVKRKLEGRRYYYYV